VVPKIKKNKIEVCMSLLKNRWLLVVCSLIVMSSVQAESEKAESEDSGFVFSSEEFVAQPSSPFSQDPREESSSKGDQTPFIGSTDIPEDDIEMVGTRALSIQEEMDFWETQAHRHHSSSSSESESEPRSGEEVLSYEDTVNAKGLYGPVFHYPSTHATYGENITFNDGSRWAVHPYSRYIILAWNASDVVFIKPNTSWFSSYRYILSNQSTGDQVEVNLIGASNYLQLVSIDFYNGILFLSDGSMWPMNTYDYSTYSNWHSYDRIIIGLNSYNRSPYYTYIIINAEDSCFVESN
jgi:hypothetical protein